LGQSLGLGGGSCNGGRLEDNRGEKRQHDNRST
jgi:hypothetical protein